MIYVFFYASDLLRYVITAQTLIELDVKVQTICVKCSFSFYNLVQVARFRLSVSINVIIPVGSMISYSLFTDVSDGLWDQRV